MYSLLLIIHVFVCLVLILVVLLQAGRGGGMSDMIGGGQPSSLFGTQTNVFLTRATEACAVMFVFTSIGLGYLTTRESKSLMDTVRLPQAPVAAKAAEMPKAPAAAEVQKAVATATQTTQAVASEAVQKTQESAQVAATAVTAAVQAPAEPAKETPPSGANAS